MQYSIVQTTTYQPDKLGLPQAARSNMRFVASGSMIQFEYNIENIRAVIILQARRE